jgi:nicotinate-nucleotide adenylyltransferase
MKPDFTRPVALFGGSFDPIHEGHLHVARAVKTAFPEMQVVFVPALESPGKQPPQASAELRLGWLRSAAEAEGHQVWETELLRPGPSFTVDTLAEAHRLGAASDRLYWIMGSDAFASLPQWREPERIRGLCKVIAVGRPGTAVPQRNAGPDFFLEIPPHPASSSALRAGLAAIPPTSMHLPEVVKAELENLSLRNKNPYARRPG